jgi:hypothetical protein
MRRLKASAWSKGDLIETFRRGGRLDANLVAAVLVGNATAVVGREAEADEDAHGKQAGGGAEEKFQHGEVFL